MSKVLILLIIISGAWANSALLMVPAADAFLPYMEGKKVKTITMDSRFGISLEPAYRSLFLALSHRSLRIRRVSESADLTISGAYRFDPVLRKLKLELFLYDSERFIAGSGELNVTSGALELIPDYRRKFDGGAEEARLLFRGKLDDLLLARAHAGTIPPILCRIRQFRLNCPDLSVQWKKQVFTELLASRFGVVFSDRSPYEISFQKNGSVLFSGRGEQNILDGVFTQEMKADKTLPKNYLASAGAGKYERTAPAGPIELSAAAASARFFYTDYPRLFARFSPDSLRSLFYQPNLPVVLSGTVTENAQGRDAVRYRWITPNHWIGALAQAHRSGSRFRVHCSVREIIQDPLVQNRFWTVAEQQWETITELGTVRYSDRGFLLVLMDIRQDGSVNRVHLFNRIWLYDYPFQFGEAPDHRLEQIRHDADQLFKELKGVDSSLKNQLREAVLNAAETL